MKSPASMKEYVRSQRPKEFKGWDGFMTAFTAVECKNRQQESMMLTIINEHPDQPGEPAETPHAVFLLDSEHDDIKVLHHNGQAKSAD